MIYKSGISSKMSGPVLVLVLVCEPLSIFTEYRKHQLITINPQLPQLYSLIKLHKKEYPVRPVVSYVTAPATKVSKILIDIISTTCKFRAKCAIKNSYELIESIKDIILPNNAKLISFDVKNLFPSIPPSDTVRLVENLLTKNNTNPVIKSEILCALETCLDQNYFIFNNIIYSSEEGLIMGNPLSPLLAEIFMDEIETIIHKNPLMKNFIYWHRYVDDIITCFTGTQRQLTTFMNFINNIHPNINFTMELELEGNINFLDLSIKKVNGKHDFSIFHKPSHTDSTIHNSSVHPYRQKLSAYNSMIHRLINIQQSEENFNKELNIIKQIAVNNGYNPETIDHILQKQRKRQAINEIYPQVRNTTTNYRSISYFGKPSEKIATFLRNQDIEIAYKPHNPLAKYIKNCKGKTNRNDNSGVYKLTCGSCPKVYIGQTGRSFKIRQAEHLRDFIKEKGNSNYASHLFEENHLFNHEIDILHIEQKGHKLNFLESLEINKLKNTGLLLNDQLDLNNSPLLNLFRT